jgi:hypothetical protein
MSNKKTFTLTTSSEISKMYFVHFALNAIVFIVANLLFPKSVVFGTECIPSGWGIFHIVSLLALVGILFVPVFEYVREQKQKELSMQDWMIGYFVINFLAVWILSRFAEQLGFGISAWWVAAVLAVILDFAQGFGATLVYKKK